MTSRWYFCIGFGMFGVYSLLALFALLSHAQAQPAPEVIEVGLVGGHFPSAAERQAVALERIATALERGCRR